jgi:polar amino acid transport system permease protein
MSQADAQAIAGLADGDSGMTWEIHPARHPWRKVTAAVAAIAAVAVIISLAKNPNVQWSVVGQYLFASLTLHGLLVTLYLTLLGVLIGIVGGVIVAVMRISPNPVLAAIARVYVELFRGTPLLVQIIFWGYMGALYHDIIIGIPGTGVVFFREQTSALIGATVAAILALGLNEIAYSSEIVRGGITGVDHGQREAALSLGMTPRQAMRKVILPQSLRMIIPPLGNEVISMLKMTSLVSVIAGHDLMTNLEDVYSQTFQVIPLLIVASIWYCTLTIVLGVFQRRLEAHFGKGHGAVVAAR